MTQITHVQGFVPGRNLMANVTDADLVVREVGLRAKAASMPSMLALDLRAAFPTIARRWLQLALAHMGAPTAFIQLVVSTHSATWALDTSGDAPSFSFELQSGVQQGCPLASVL